MNILIIPTSHPIILMQWRRNVYIEYIRWVNIVMFAHYYELGFSAEKHHPSCGTRKRKRNIYAIDQRKSVYDIHARGAN